MLEFTIYSAISTKQISYFSQRFIMKTTLLTLFLSSLLFTNFAQELSYEIHGKYKRPVSAEKLNDAKSISDLIVDYPANWVTDYVSVEISATNDGKTLKATSPDATLTAAQKNIMNTAKLGTEMTINVLYKYKNTITANIEDHLMNVVMTVIPAIEAEFVGGKEALNNYLKENGNNFSETTAMQYQAGIVRFNVNEEGEIADVEIAKTSGDLKTDKLLLDIINKMPKWKPAQNSKGVKVKQAFVFSVGRAGC
jgi:TonB family protein